MNIESAIGLIFEVIGGFMLIGNIFIFKDRETFMFIFIVLSAGLILAGIGKVLDGLSKITDKK